MKQLSQFSILKQLSANKSQDTDENFVYFVAFLYSIATGQVGPVDLVRTTSQSEYGKYSSAFRETFRLGVGWLYGIAKSLETVANRIAEKKDDQFRQLLVKLAQVVRLGDDLMTFFHSEIKNTLFSYGVVYQRKLDVQKLYLEIFYTLMSTATFMIAANSVLTMLIGSGDANQILISSLFAISGGMGSFVVMMYLRFPRDKLAFGNSEKDLKFRLIIYVTLAIGTSLGVVLWVMDIVHSSLIVGIAAAPLFIPGILARREEKKIKELNKWYPDFIRHFGELYATVGSMGQTLDSILRSDFGPLQKHLISFKNRIKNRTDQKTSFELLSRDSHSEIIANGNQVISTSLEKGGNMKDAGNMVSDITTKINELRAKREQSSKTFETIVVVLHVLTLAVFGLMNRVTEVFFDLITTLETNSAFQLNPIDPDFMASILPIVILINSVVTAMALKVTQGGSYKTVFYHIALLVVIGSLISFVMYNVLTDFLESPLINIVEEF